MHVTGSMGQKDLMVGHFSKNTMVMHLHSFHLYRGDPLVPGSAWRMNYASTSSNGTLLDANSSLLSKSTTLDDR